MVSVSALGAGGYGFLPRPRHTEEWHLSGYLAWRSALKGMHWHMPDMLVTTVHPDLTKANCPYQGGRGPEHALRNKLSLQKLRPKTMFELQIRMLELQIRMLCPLVYANQRTIGPENAHLKPDPAVLSHHEITLTLNTHTPFLNS